MRFDGSLFSIPVAILLGALIIAFSNLIASGVVTIGKPTGTAPTQQGAAPTQAQPTQPTQAPPSSAKVSVDDDPVLGDKNAPVTIIEFSDYECPFCKRHFDQTYPEIKKNYIDTGKVKLVFRDFPLSFHDPMATKEAIAATCARDQGGDEAYFKMHDEMFTQTTSNGTGLTDDKIYQIATNIGLNADILKSCVEAEKYKAEVAADIKDGNAGGVTGTPSFFIGKSDASGIIDGKILVGAQPYSAFQTTIDALLK